MDIRFRKGWELLGLRAFQILDLLNQKSRRKYSDGFLQIYLYMTTGGSGPILLFISDFLIFERLNNLHIILYRPALECQRAFELGERLAGTEEAKG